MGDDLEPRLSSRPRWHLLFPARQEASILAPKEPDHTHCGPSKSCFRIMKKTTDLLLILSTMAMLVACSQRSRTVIGGPDAQEAAIRFEESHQEYDNCIATRQAGGPTCDSLKALYEKDKAEYESQVN